MDNSELMEFDLLASEQRKLDLQEQEMSIRQAIIDFGFDKFSRDKLECEAARNLLELNDLVDRVNLLSEVQKKNILGTLGFLGGNPTGILKNAFEKGIKKQKTDFARENAYKGVAKRPSSIALKKIRETEYPLKKHLFHLEGRIILFANEMHFKYPEIKNIGAINRLISKLNKENGIINKV